MASAAPAGGTSSVAARSAARDAVAPGSLGASRARAAVAAARSSPTTTIRPSEPATASTHSVVAAQDEARDAEPGRLALDAARIGEDGRGVELERQRRPVALRLDDADVRAGRSAPRASSAARVPGMEGEDDRAFGRGDGAAAGRPTRRSPRARGSRRGGSSRRGSRRVPAAARAPAVDARQHRRVADLAARPARRGPASGRRRGGRRHDALGAPGWRRRSASGRTASATGGRRRPG